MVSQQSVSWEAALDEISILVNAWRRRKRVAQVLCPVFGIALFALFWWGESWTLRAWTLPLGFLLMMVFLWGVLLNTRLRDKLVDAVERDVSTDDICHALRLLALLPTLGIRTGGEALQGRVVSRLALASREQFAGLQESERALLYSWAESGTNEERVTALLVLAMIGDKATRALAQRYQLGGATIDERVREAAIDFLKQVE